MTLDLIAALGGLIVPPVFDFAKKLFIKEERDTPERTMSSLATTNPEVLPSFVEALAKTKEAASKFFNRDVIGTPSQWIIDLRAGIRPVGVILSFLTLAAMVFFNPIGESVLGVRLTCEAICSSWFGDRIRLK